MTECSFQDQIRTADNRIVSNLTVEEHGKSIAWIAINRAVKRYSTFSNLAKVLGVTRVYLYKIRALQELPNPRGVISLEDWVKVTGMTKEELYPELYQ